MVPFAILGGELKTENRNIEIRVLDLAVDSFSFRLAKGERIRGEYSEIILHFFVFSEKCYYEVRLEKLQIELLEEAEYFNVYRVKTESKEYEKYARIIMREYMEYIRLKCECSDARISERMTTYQEEKEAEFAEDFVSQKTTWFQQCVNETEWRLEALEHLELGIHLDHEECYQQFLEYPPEKFVENFWRKSGLCGHPISKMKVSHIYIGNEYCPLLFPEQKKLEQMLELIRREKWKPVIVFSYLQENDIKRMESILTWLADWTQNEKELEIVVNDWGMLSMLRKKQYKCFKIILGKLLQKRVKDVRMEYRGLPLKKHSGKCQDLEYLDYLEKYFSVERYTTESAETQSEIMKGKTELHLPFFQMNTSQYCTLYARCRNGGRGEQQEVRCCPRYCREKVFLYPSILHMVGRYNSLIGYDRTILKSKERIEQYIDCGIDRIVVNVL